MVFPVVLLYTTELSVTAAPPDLKVATGVSIASEAVKVMVTSSPGLASVLVVLSEAMLTLLSVGAVVSGNDVLKLAAGGKTQPP